MDEYGHAGQGIQLRNLKQPFNWHEDQEMVGDGAGGGVGGGEAGRGAPSKNETAKHEMSTCRNSVQGKMIIADDKGTMISMEMMGFRPGCGSRHNV